MAISTRRDWNFFAKSFLAGGVAGMASKTTVAPLDRIKILLQCHNTYYKNFGVFSGMTAIVRQESFSSLYKGNGAQMVRIFPYAAVQFMSFEAYKRALTSLFPSKKVNHELKFFAGSAAGVTSVLVTYPLDLVRARLASVVSSKSDLETLSKKKGTIAGTLFHVFKHEGGIRGLYRGITPTVLAMIPYGGCNFYMFERLKHLCVEYVPTLTCYRNPNNADQLVLKVPAKLICGGIAGAIGQTAIYPLDVARRRMQLSMASKDTLIYSKGFLQAMLITYQQHGVTKGLYRGMSANYIRAIPMVAVSFCTYEVLKQLLGMETGINPS